MDADQLALAIRWKSFDEARDLLRSVQGISVRDVLAEAQTIADFLNGTMTVEQAPTAEGPMAAWDNIPHLVSSEGEIIPITDDVQVAEVNLAPGTLPENTVVVEERPAKAASRKPKPKKAKSARKPKAVREQVRDEVGTDTRSEGDPIPANGDPVPGEGEKMQEAA